MASSQRFSAEEYFATQPPPQSIGSDLSRIRSFVSFHRNTGRRIVLVTSGGTTVPLELNVVRFLDNFSAGTRGATSAEYFLKAGYAVIFLHRQFSLQPFSRHYSHSTNPFLDLLVVAESSSERPQICVKEDKATALYPILKTYQTVQSEETLMSLPFVTLTEYLFLLRAISQELSVLGRSAMFYLAAAVSDFFIPREKMSEHKIQSSTSDEDKSTPVSKNLSIEMDHTPKILKPMVTEWAKGGYVVSFKLETDQNLLIPKSQAALKRYGHQLVIGNNLHTRKHEVVFVEPLTLDPDPKEFKETWLRIPTTSDKEIEEDIISALIARHEAWIKQNGQ